MHDLLDGKSCGHEFPERARAGMEHCTVCLQAALASAQEETRLFAIAHRNLEADLLRAQELKEQAEDAASRAISKMAHTEGAWGEAVEKLFRDRSAVTSPDGRFTG